MVKTALERVLESPHGSIEFGKPIPKSGRSRRPLTTSPESGLMDELFNDSESAVNKVSKAPEARERRTPLFSKGTQLYAYQLDTEGDDQLIIPGVPNMTNLTENDLRREVLEFDTQLRIDPELGLKEGKNGSLVIRKVGKSWAGAFTVIRFPTDDGKGNTAEELRLVDLRKRNIPSQNQKRRFGQANR